MNKADLNQREIIKEKMNSYECKSGTSYDYIEEEVVVDYYVFKKNTSKIYCIDFSFSSINPNEFFGALVIFKKPKKRDEIALNIKGLETIYDLIEILKI